jgi:bifunctional non-homologous end joining protein LigD
MTVAGTADEERAGVALTHLDQPLLDGSDVTKRELVDYLDAVSGPLIGQLRDRPLSVIRVRPGQPPFMQKNVPKYTPSYVPTVTVWAESSRREVRYALCNDRRTLLWLANQRAVEYHPTLVRAEHWQHPDFLILDIDPPVPDEFGPAVQAAFLVKAALEAAGLAGAVKTSGAKGLHVFVREDRGGKVFLDATRAGGATVAAVYSPRARPGVPVSFPVRWEDLESVQPADFTVRTAAGILAGDDRWAQLLPVPQELPADLIAAGHEIPIARVQAMHEGKRRARARREAGDPDG